MNTTADKLNSCISDLDAAVNEQSSTDHQLTTCQRYAYMQNTINGSIKEI